MLSYTQCNLRRGKPRIYEEGIKEGGLGKTPNPPYKLRGDRPVAPTQSPSRATLSAVGRSINRFYCPSDSATFSTSSLGSLLLTIM